MTHPREWNVRYWEHVAAEITHCDCDARYCDHDARYCDRDARYCDRDAMRGRYAGGNVGCVLNDRPCTFPAF